MKTTITKCDICKRTEDVQEKKMDVIFHTEQTEGRGVEPHLSNEKLDICDRCLQIVLNGNYVHGQGAMGYNEYFFRDLGS